MLRLVAIDEVHLYALHGLTFWESIHVLSDVFFKHLFGSASKNSPLFQAMTAMMTAHPMKQFSRLTHVDWASPKHQHWSSPKEFRQRNITMDLHVSRDIKNVGLVDIVNVMKCEQRARACVFVNFCLEALKWIQVLEGMLSEELLRTAVLQINGDMDKSKKFAFI